MSRWNAVKKTCAMSRELRRQRGGSALRYFADALYCSYTHGASPENYVVLRFYQLPDFERAKYLTSGRSKALDARLNAGATEHDRQLLARKELFNQAFAGLVSRGFVYAPSCSFSLFSSFLRRYPFLISKPSGGTMGRGIERFATASVDAQALYARCVSEARLLEEPIRQHPLLAQINPSSVNSVRINAARSRNGELKLIGACLKCGGEGAVTDNFHTGGVAYPLDLSTGRVSGPGRNNCSVEDFVRHPGSGVLMPGFSLPFWPETLACVERAMSLVPSVGYVGWDIAITPSGPELIEGNYSWPGGNIIQFDHVGKYPLLLSCLQEGD